MHSIFIVSLYYLQVGTACLPDDINRADSKKLNGPHVLQLVEATDISQSSKFKDAPEDRKGRLLRLKMTDGSRTCIGVEYNPIPALRAADLIPGVKIKIAGATLRVGCLLLDSKSISVLGGRVEKLAASWEVQQLYGGTGDRGAGIEGGSTKGESGAPDKPPPFKHFDPNSAPKQMANVKKALAAVFVPKVGVVATVGRASGSGPNSQPNKQPVKGESGSGVLPKTAAAPMSAHATAAAKEKLLERLAAHEEEFGRRGRGGRRGGRRGRRGRFDDDDDDDTTLTFEEYEAKKKEKLNMNLSGGSGGGPSVTSPSTTKLITQAFDASGQMLSDEELARQLQAQLDLEDQMEESGNTRGIGGRGGRPLPVFY